MVSCLKNTVHSEIRSLRPRRCAVPQLAIRRIVERCSSTSTVGMSGGSIDFNDEIFWQSMNAPFCQHCRFPCHDVDSSGCNASPFLAHWGAQHDLKPAGYDAELALRLPGSIDVGIASYGGVCGGGWKAENQDAFFVEPLAEHHSASTFTVGVLDGHGRLGRAASQQARKAFVASLGKPQRLGHGNDHALLLESSFMEAAKALRSSSLDFSRSGATAVVCIVDPEGIHVGWAGDSRAILGISVVNEDDSDKLICVPLTEDHRPERASERKRILAAGGRVGRVATDADGNLIGPLRVFRNDTWIPGLAITRALGDHIANPAGIIPNPEIRRVSLDWGETSRCGRRHVLLVASDGVWEWLTSSQAMSIAAAQPDAQHASAAVVEAARKKWAVKYQGHHCDDITAVVTFIPC